MYVQAGTLSGNPLAMVAGLKTLEILDRPGTYEYLEKITDRLITGLLNEAKEAGHEVCGGHISGTLLYSAETVLWCCRLVDCPGVADQVMQHGLSASARTVAYIATQYSALSHLAGVLPKSQEPMLGIWRHQLVI